MSGVTLEYLSQSNINFKNEVVSNSRLKTADSIAGDIACNNSTLEDAPFEKNATLIYSKNIQLEFGAGYARPYQSNNAFEDTQKRGEEGNKPVSRA
jgi:hypothetical protein